MPWERVHWMAGAGSYTWIKPDPCMDYRSINSWEAVVALCYPTPTRDCYDRIVRLKSLGIDRLCTYTPIVLPGGVRVAGKGHSSTVPVFKAPWGPVAVKSRRPDGRRGSFYSEGLFIQAASRGGVAPRIYYYDDDLIVMDYIAGPSLADIIEVYRYMPHWSVQPALSAARVLDVIGILHYEIHRPWKNIFYTSRLNAVILDYESAGKGCGNVAKIISGISKYHGRLRDLIRDARFSKLLKTYKKRGCPENLYSEILSLILS